MLLEGFPVIVKVMPEPPFFLKNELVVWIPGRYRFFGTRQQFPDTFARPGLASAAVQNYTCLMRPFRPFLCFTPQVFSNARMIGQTTWIDGAERVSEHLFSGNIPAIGTMPHAFVRFHTKPEVAKHT
jgi:nicotinate phosphoribosyltransferase